MGDEICHLHLHETARLHFPETRQRAPHVDGIRQENVVVMRDQLDDVFACGVVVFEIAQDLSGELCAHSCMVVEAVVAQQF